MRMSILIVLMNLCFIFSCHPSQPPTMPVRFIGNVQDASVIIDDEYVGTLGYVSKRGVAMSPGTHCVSIEKPGYFPMDQIILVDDKPMTIQIHLESIPE